LLASCFEVLKRTRKIKNLPLRFYPFFAPPILSEKGKGKFCFAVAGAFSGGDGAENYHALGACELSIASRLLFKKGSRKG